MDSSSVLIQLNAHTKKKTKQKQCAKVCAHQSGKKERIRNEMKWNSIQGYPVGNAMHDILSSRFVITFILKHQP